MSHWCCSALAQSSVAPSSDNDFVVALQCHAGTGSIAAAKASGHFASPVEAGVEASVGVVTHDRETTASVTASDDDFSIAL